MKRKCGKPKRRNLRHLTTELDELKKEMENWKQQAIATQEENKKNGENDQQSAPIPALSSNIPDGYRFLVGRQMEEEQKQSFEDRK